RFGGDGLQQFLQLALGILHNWNCADVDKVAAEFAQDEFARGLKTAVEENCADERFVGIRESRWALASAVGFFTAAERKVRAEIQRGAVGGECQAIHQLRARFRQGAFVEAGKFFVEFAGEDELQDGVAEELK